MKIIADLHLHSKYSRAVSQEMTLPKMYQWAVKKGIGLLATGDWTHPLWFREIKANLEEVAEGLYGLKVGDAAGYEFSHSTLSSSASDLSHSTESRVGKGAAVSVEMSKIVTRRPLFVLSTEISSIYSQSGKGHRIHNVVLAPSIETVEKINKALINHGANLMSDGRPITGIPAPDLVKLILGVDENCLIIPAHIWTPWFSLYGSESGFDSLSECFGDMAKYIYAIETGLSSDPAMNWRISELDNRSIISCSDAHSGPKLGREATVFNLAEINYSSVREALMTTSSKYKVESIKGNNEEKILNTKYLIPNTISYTLEFYPEEGKYHYTGHRTCGVKQSPEETKKLGEICPVCGKHLTIGVMHRVEKLSNLEIKKLRDKIREKTDEYGVKWIAYDERPPYVMLVPLQEILAEAIGGLPASQNVQNEYEKLVAPLRQGFAGQGEFGVLLNIPIEEIAKISGERVAEGISKVRKGDIVVEPGYDGVFGIVKIWSFDKAQDKAEEEKQMSLF